MSERSHSPLSAHRSNPPPTPRLRCSARVWAGVSQGLPSSGAHHTLPVSLKTHVMKPQSSMLSMYSGIHHACMGGEERRGPEERITEGNLHYFFEPSIGSAECANPPPPPTPCVCMCTAPALGFHASLQRTRMGVCLSGYFQLRRQPLSMPKEETNFTTPPKKNLPIFDTAPGRSICTTTSRADLVRTAPSSTLAPGAERCTS